MDADEVHEIIRQSVRDSGHEDEELANLEVAYLTTMYSDSAEPPRTAEGVRQVVGRALRALFDDGCYGDQFGATRAWYETLECIWSLGDAPPGYDEIETPPSHTRVYADRENVVVMVSVWEDCNTRSDSRFLVTTWTEYLDSLKMNPVGS